MTDGGAVGGRIGAAGVTGAARMMEHDRASAAAGLRVLRLADGAADVAMTVRDDMVNGHRITHGGYVFLLADTAFACACNDEAGVTVATGADISFLVPTGPGDVLLALARRRVQRGRTGVYDVTVLRLPPGSDPDDPAADGEVVAEFRGRSRTLPAPG